MLFDSDQIAKMIRELVPLGHFTATHEEASQQANLGFGFLYYGIARVLAPLRVLVIGSLRGFSPVCFALGLRDNGAGRVDFVDAAMVDDFWKDAERVKAHFSQFGVSEYISHFAMPSSQYLRETGSTEAVFDLLFIDGDHSFAGVAHDYSCLGRLVKDDGYILLHDSFAGGFGYSEWEVADFLSTLTGKLAQMVTFTVAQGLTLIKRIRPSDESAEVAELERTLQAALQIARSKTTDGPELSQLLLQAISLNRLRNSGFEAGLELLRKANHDLRRELLRSGSP